MAGVNKVILIGNLGADPEVKYMENGTCVANINIATSRSYTNKNNEKVEETEWHRIVLWRKLGEITEKFLKKGNTVYIEGRLTTRKWTDQNGTDRYTTEVVAENMNMLGGKSNPNNAAPTEASSPVSEPKNENTGSEVASGAEPDDLPF